MSGGFCSPGTAQRPLGSSIPQEIAFGTDLATPHSGALPAARTDLSGGEYKVVGTMNALSRKAVIVGLGCLAAGVHSHYCEWHTEAFPKRRAVFGLQTSPVELLAELLAYKEMKGRDQIGSLAPWDRAHGAARSGPGHLTGMDYAWGIAAADDEDVKAAMILGVLLPLGMLFVAFDTWVGRPTSRPTVSTATYRLPSGHCVTV